MTLLSLTARLCVPNRLKFQEIDMKCYLLGGPCPLSVEPIYMSSPVQIADLKKSARNLHHRRLEPYPDASRSKSVPSIHICYHNDVTTADLVLAPSKMSLCLVEILVILVTDFLEVVPGCQLSMFHPQAYSYEGDVVFGGIVPVHAKSVKSLQTFRTWPLYRVCEKFYIEKYQSVLAMVFATEEINQNSQLLPNLTLGFKIYDSCYSESAAIESTMGFLSRNQGMVPNYMCGHEKAKLAAVVGDSPSSSSVSMARILGLSMFPQISYGSALPSLADKLQFPSFVRTIGTVDSQPIAVVQLLMHFNWTWVGLIASNNDYGEQGSHKLKEEMAKNGICVSFAKTLLSQPSKEHLVYLANVIKTSTANIIILYAYASELAALLEEVKAKMITGKVWIAIGSWLPSDVFSNRDLWDILNGTLGLAKYSSDIPGFRDFLHSVHPSKYPKDIFIKLFWEKAFNCKWRENGNQSDMEQLLREGNVPFCNGKEELVGLDSSVYHVSNFRFACAVSNAVYAVAHAIHSMMSCRSGLGPFFNGTCASIHDFQPWQLLYHIKNVNFWNTGGERVAFDEQGELKGLYDVLNWQVSSDGKGSFVKVGIFDDWGPKGQKLMFEKHAIFWGKLHTQVPRSVCSESCPQGYRKVARKGQPVCCYDCIPCPEGEISNQTDTHECLKCPEDQWSNENLNKCIPKVIEFLAFEEPLGMALTSLSSIFSLLTVSVLCVFIKYSDTAIVKANNRNLSYLLLLALLLCFLCSFLFIGHPWKIKCLIRQAVLGISFSLSLSCVLAKTITVVIAFNATKPNSSLKRWVGSSIPNAIVLICSGLQVLICISWVIIYPSSPELNRNVSKDRIIIECKEGSIVFFYVMLAFMGLLATITLVVAFLARKLPDGFNEAKFITFSMLVFTSVWISFIPAYMSIKGKYTVTVELFAILASSFGLLCCIFFPKCHIIILRPEMNSREYLIARNKLTGKKK
ncbi:extracellular calcium-sensing receptor-like [Microcaecilia unicolor]|uniref:Extracellular calcium-sensing receptor-like n=1 Tax=Microcaecilia unicolor TaxID=1415580 RepID=A0A6P7YV22_9AMPH|nr:extracellular calcium-sensing receptor-like [Microcaecilia unicolor]